MDALDPEVAALVEELNTFGEDTEPQVDREHVPASRRTGLAYLALVRTMLAPLQRQGRLNALTHSTRALGHAHGAVLASATETVSAAGHAAIRARIAAACSSNIRSRA